MPTTTETNSAVVTGEDVSSHSASSDDSDVKVSECQQDEEEEEEDVVEVSSPKLVKQTKQTLIRVILLFVGFVIAALAVDVFLYYKMEFTVKTIDAVLNEDNPDATLRISLDVSSRMLFSSINVKSFTCQAFHKAPHDAEEGQFFALATNEKGFETNTMIQNLQAAEEHFIENMDITLSGIDFDILKQAIQDSYFTVNQTATRLDCSLNADVNMLGMASFAWPNVKQKFKHECRDCETQGGFQNTDVFMASVVGSLVTQKSSDPTRRRETFSENAEEFVFTMDKHFDLSKSLGSVESFKIAVPSAEYVIASEGQDEFWTTTTTPFSLDLATEGGSDLLSVITTTCTNMVSNEPCKMSDPMTEFLNDVWNGHIKFEMSSVSAAATLDERFRSTAIQEEEKDEENFVEAMLGLNVNLDLDMNLNVDFLSDFTDNVEVNRRLSHDDEADLSESNSLTLKMYGKETEVVQFQLDASRGWPGHEGGMMSTVDLRLFDGEVTMSVDVNAGRRDMKLTVRDVKTSKGQVANMGLDLDWHMDEDDRKAWVKYIVSFDGTDQREDTLTFPYGKFVDYWNGFESDVDDDMHEEWQCLKITRDDTQGRLELCAPNNDHKHFNLTYYDSDMMKVVGVTGSVKSASDKIDFSARGDLTVYDDEFFNFDIDKVTRMRLDGAVSRHGVDLFLDIQDVNNVEVFLVRLLTGWKDVNSFADMGLTRTQVMLTVDDSAVFSMDMNELDIRYHKFDDIKLLLDQFSLVIDDDKLIDTTIKVMYTMNNVDLQWLLKLKEEELVYLKLLGMVDYDSPQNWHVEFSKGLVRLKGEERFRVTMKGHMEMIPDAMHDHHSAVTVEMFLSVNKEEYMNLQQFHADIISDAHAEELTIASSVHGIMHMDQIINGTIFIDKMHSDWTISTSDFDISQPLVVSVAPTMAPTVYAHATKTVLEVKTKVVYRTTKTAFENNAAAQSASIAAFKKSLNQTGATVIIDSITTEFIDNGARRRLAIVEGIKVTYKATIIAELAGMDAATLYTKMQTSITAAVTSGSFESNLVAAFVDFDVTETFTAEETVSVDPPVVVDAIQAPTGMPSGMPTSVPSEEPVTPFPTPVPTPVPSNMPSEEPLTTFPTPTPTHSPTAMPTATPSSLPTAIVLPSSGESSFSTTNIIIIAVVVPVGILLSGVVAYFMMQQKKKSFMIVPTSTMPVGIQQ